MQEWLEHNFQINDVARPGDNKFIISKRARVVRPRSLIVEGPTSSIGKTAWARSLGPHNYIWGHLEFNPRTFHNDVLYNVNDDVDPSYLRLKHGSDSIMIKGGVPSIILCNHGSDSSYREFLDRPDN